MHFYFNFSQACVHARFPFINDTCKYRWVYLYIYVCFNNFKCFFFLIRKHIKFTRWLLIFVLLKKKQTLLNLYLLDTCLLVNLLRNTCHEYFCMQYLSSRDTFCVSMYLFTADNVINLVFLYFFQLFCLSSRLKETRPNRLAKFFVVAYHSSFECVHHLESYFMH